MLHQLESIKSKLLQLFLRQSNLRIRRRKLQKNMLLHQLKKNEKHVKTSNKYQLIQLITDYSRFFIILLFRSSQLFRTALNRHNKDFRSLKEYCACSV